MTGMSTPSTRAFTTDRSATPCRLRRADGWRACKTRKDAPDAWRVLASVSVDDTGLQRRNFAETGTHNECEREETVWHIKHRTLEKKYTSSGFAHRCPGRGASLSFRASTPRNVLLWRSLADNQDSDLCHFAREKMHQRACGGPRKNEMVIAQRVPHTNTITEVHNRLCTTNDHFLVISAHLDYHRSRRGRTAQFQCAAMKGEIVRIREESSWFEHFGVCQRSAMIVH